MTNPILAAERPHAVLGIEGRYMGATVGGRGYRPGTFTTQRWLCSAPIDGYGAGARITAELRFDDDCRNGRNTFALTADVRRPRALDIEAGGCLHDDIVRVWPALAQLVPWHLVSTDGPMHYAANVVYLAGDKDHWGMRKGERRPIVGPDGVPTWILKTPDGFRPHRRIEVKQHEKPAPVTLDWELWCREGEGKQRELESARRAAIWPDAPDDVLCAEPDALRRALADRLPALLAEFRRLMVDVCGFAWSPDDLAT